MPKKDLKLEQVIEKCEWRESREVNKFCYLVLGRRLRLIGEELGWFHLESLWQCNVGRGGFFDAVTVFMCPIWRLEKL